MPCVRMVEILWPSSEVYGLPLLGHDGLSRAVVRVRLMDRIEPARAPSALPC